MRCYPTDGQAARATRLLASHCEMYNAALQERRDAWRMNRVSVTYGQQSAQLRDIRAVRPDVACWSFTAQQQTLRRLNRSFDAFFRRVKAGQAPGFPRFKAAARFDTVDHVNGDGAKWTATEGRWARANFQGVGSIKVSEHTRVQGRVTRVSLRREGRRWYVVVVVDSEPLPLSETGVSVGIDVGVARFLVASDGFEVANPRFLAAAADELDELQRRLALCDRGSGNRKRVKRAIAKLHRQVANRRRNFHHQTARILVDRYDAVAFEDLNIAGMTRRAKPKPDPDSPGQFLPNMAAAKSGLNRSILDAAWSQFLGIYTAKAAWAGRRGIPTNPRGTSIDCHLCGAATVRPRQDTVICPTHGPLPADWNASVNIATRAGLGSGEAAAAA